MPPAWWWSDSASRAKGPDRPPRPVTSFRIQEQAAWSGTATTRDAGGVPNYRVRFEGPATLTLGVATELADADGVELISSEQPVVLDGGVVALDVTVEGAFDEVADAVASIRVGMPSGASIEITGG